MADTFLRLAMLPATLLLSSCVVGQIAHSPALKGLEKRTGVALKEFDDNDYPAAARDCAAVYEEYGRKLDGTSGRYMDYSASRDNQKLLAMCAADSHYQLRHRAEACRWYPLGDWRTAMRGHEPRRYCGY